MKTPKEFIETEYNNGGIVKPDGWKNSEVIEAIERYVQTELKNIPFQPHVSESVCEYYEAIGKGKTDCRNCGHTVREHF